MPVLLAALAPLVLASTALVQEKPADPLAVEMGASLYRTHCGSCHGRTGEGDGPMADQLRFAPPDLTKLARRTKGGFAAEDVGRIVDGRNPLKGHGGPEMPIWGDAFLESQAGYSREKARERIALIVMYLRSIQK